MYTINYKDAGKRLLNLRKQKNLTQTQVSNNTNIDASLISGYENGNKNFGLDNLMRLAKEYGVSLDFIIFGKDEKTIEYKVIEKPIEEKIIDAALLLFENGKLSCVNSNEDDNSFVAVSYDLTDFLFTLHNTIGYGLDEDAKKEFKNILTQQYLKKLKKHN